MKLMSLDRLLKRLDGLRAGKTIVCYNGSFDLLHVGHLRSLQEAKSKGDILIVLLNSDVSVKAYKGPGRPIVPEQERAELLSAIDCVDYIVLFDDLTPIPVLELLKPDIFCNGSDYGANCIERETVERNGGRVAVLSWQSGQSTSDIIRRIKSLPLPVKAVFLDRDNTLIEDPNGYIHKVEDFLFVSKCIDALRLLEGSEYKKIIVTDQSGIGRGYYSAADYERFTNHMLSEFKKNGITIDRVYHCPHAPDDGCECRKPGVGLFLDAVRDFGISLSQSWYIGDKVRDVTAGRMANLKTIKLGARMPAEQRLEPNYYASDLYEAVEHIVGKR